ncbi:hypothetical protein ACH5RR_002960 [Cinchona calisaya]|uniref:Uncharacterized protein n=1 Tax=Cinchona calisaya TaxID=153742 RepID=A0ABD3AU15_9GENT
MMNEEDKIGMIKLLISFWSRYARFVSEWYTEDQELQFRLKNTDELVQMVIHGNEELVVSNLNILKSLAGEILDIEDLRLDADADDIAITSPSSVFAGEVLQMVMTMILPPWMRRFPNSSIFSFAN